MLALKDLEAALVGVTGSALALPEAAMTQVRILAGTDSFAELRGEGYQYVDKTAMLERLLSRRSDKVVLFTRPRRFGKSLAMSMMAEFLDIEKKGREALFDGLAVMENKEFRDTWMHSHPVFFISLKEMEAFDFNSYLRRLKIYFSELMVHYMYLLQSPALDENDRLMLQKLRSGGTSTEELQNALRFLSRALSAHHGRPTVILVDEYDVPLATAAAHGYHDEMLRFMRGMFSSAFKSNEHLLLGVMTGCLPMTNESLFTGFNNFARYDISSADYAEAFGFTEAEVDRLFEDAGLSEKRAEALDWYDGYRFGDGRKVCCPWDIARHVAALQSDPKSPPLSYWKDSSGNRFLAGFAARRSPAVEDGLTLLGAGGRVAARLADSVNHGELAASDEDFWTLLYHTGYLTKAEGALGLSLEEGETALVVPNREVAAIFESELGRLFKDLLKSVDRTRLLKAFWDGDADGFIGELSSILEKTASVFDYQEYFYHALLAGLFAASCRVASKAESETGRCGLLVRTRNSSRGAVIEVKRTTKPEELRRLPDLALSQIAAKGYDARLRSAGCESVLHWGLAFHVRDCAAKVRVAPGL